MLGLQVSAIRSRRPAAPTLRAGESLGRAPQPQAVPEDEPSPPKPRCRPRTAPRHGPSPAAECCPTVLSGGCSCSPFPSLGCRGPGSQAGSAGPSPAGRTRVLCRFRLLRASSCTRLPGTAPTPGARAGPAPAWLVRASLRAGVRGQRGAGFMRAGGRKDSASPSASAMTAAGWQSPAWCWQRAGTALGDAVVQPRGPGLRPPGEINRRGPASSALETLVRTCRAGHCMSRILSAHCQCRTSLDAISTRQQLQAGGSIVGLLAGRTGRLVSDKAQVDVAPSQPQLQPSARPFLHPPL